MTTLSPDGYEAWEVGRLSFGSWMLGLFPGVAMNVDGVPVTTLRFQLLRAGDGRALIAALTAAGQMEHAVT